MRLNITLDIQDAEPAVLSAITAALAGTAAVTLEAEPAPTPKNAKAKKEKAPAAEPAPAPEPAGPTMDDMKHKFAEFTGAHPQDGPNALREIMRRHGAPTPKLSELDASTYPAVLAEIDAWRAA